MNTINFKPIGIIYSPFKEPKGTPIQPKAAKGVKGKIEIYPDYVEALKDLEGFSYIILLYYFHLVKGYKLLVKPFMDDKFHGLFATRAPARPNPIGLSIVELIEIKENFLFINDVDIVDGTPLLDIKPYVPGFDLRKPEKIGWLEKNIHKMKKVRDDERFLK